jgi:hypothetical protein
MTTSSTSTAAAKPPVVIQASGGETDGVRPGVGSVVGAAAGPAGEGGAQLPPSAVSLPAGPPSVIPVGQEPPRQPRADSETLRAPAGQQQATRSPGQPLPDKDRKIRPPLRNPEGFYKYKNRLDEIRVFRAETMRHLRRAELTVWEAIHGCQFNGSAQISQQKIAEIAGIKSRQHVGKAIKSLRKKGLLEVLVEGRYKPNGVEGHGLSSVYRTYPRPEPRLLKAARPDSQTSPGGGEVDSGDGSSAKETTTGLNPKRRKKPR